MAKQKIKPSTNVDTFDLLDVLAIEHTTEPAPPRFNRVFLGWVAMRKGGHAHTGTSGAGAKVYKSEAVAKASVKGNRNRNIDDFVFVQAYVDLPTTE